MAKLLFLSFLIFMNGPTARALEIESLNYNDTFVSGPDLASKSSSKALSSPEKLKWYQLKSQWQQCVQQAESLKNSGLGVWPKYLHMRCLNSLQFKKSSWKVSRLLESYSQLATDNYPLLHSAYEGHKEAYINLFLSLAERAFEKARSRFDWFIEKHQKLIDYMSAEQRARYYKILGEKAWLEQKNEIAKSNFLRSYQFQKSSEVLKRLKELKAEEPLKLNKYKFDFVEAGGENKLWGKFSGAVKAGQSFKVAKYGADFLSQFPGSERASDVRNQVNRYFKRILYRRGPKYKAAKRDFHRQLKKAPASSIMFWAQEAYDRGYMDSSHELAEKAADLWEKTPRAPEALLMMAKSSYYLAKKSDAITSLEVLIKHYSGHEASSEAQYLLGLLYYRHGEYKKVIKIFEKFMQSSGSDRFELQVKYWLYRSLKKINSSRATTVAEDLLRVFPLTYYGLLVRMEEKKGVQDLFAKTNSSGFSARYFWTGANRTRFQRIKSLIKVGWFDEAETEIDFLPDPQSPEAFLVRAKIWRAANRENRAIKDYAEAIDRDVSFITKPLMSEAFPTHYLDPVQAAEKEFSVSRNLIWAVIRQESAFRPRAISPSLAYGLMQLLAPTGKETAKWLKQKNFQAPRDLFKPQVNIRFGTHFLSRMLRKYKGVVPLAVASYNVGPGNLDRWLRYRVDLSDWDKIGQSPDGDIWMDELPWAETSFYVKAVLRNYLLYKIIHEEYNVLSRPAWSEAVLSQGA